MDDYTVLRSQVLLGFTYAKIQSSLDEIKTKHPTRTDLINSMEETLEHIQEVKLSWNQFEQEFRAMRQNAYRLELVNLDLNTENKRLEAINKALNYEE
jgi:DNA topoisomerase IA